MRNTLFILLTFTLLLSSCKKENTVWETDWSAPVINDSLSLSNLVNDSTLDVVSGYYSVDLERTLLDRGVNDVLEIPDTTINKDFGIAFAFINVPPNYTFFNEESENDLGFADVELKQIIAKEGFLDVTVKNPVETKALFNVKLVGVTKDGVEFSEDIVADAGTIANPGIVTTTLDLSGYSFDLMGIDGDERNILTSKVTVTSDPNGPSVTLTNSHIVQVDVGLRGIELSYARGYFGNQTVSDTTDFVLDVMNVVQSGAVDIPASTIKFEIENGIKVGASGLLTKLTSESTSGNMVDLVHPQIGTAFTLNPATGGWNGINPSIKELIFDQANSNVEAFVENLGSKYTAGYEVEINPWGNVSAGSDEIYPDSRFKVRAYANLPLAIGFDALVVQDTFPVDLVQTSTTARVTSGELLLKASNAFPVSANVKLIMLDANKSVLHTINGTDIIQSAEYGDMDANSGLKIMKSDIKWILTSEVVDDLANIKYIIVQSAFNTPDPSTSVNDQYQIPAGAFIGVKLRTRFTTENQF
ncbi:MAG: hypothetical protein P8P74_17955 [Crocinitomicaceae bacterium]|nr:hypothetical protein [Crocinitomicaceae bacterium]